MRLLNCRIDESVELFENRKIIFFGKGSWLQCVNYTDIMILKDSFAYIVDNDSGGKAILGEKEYKVYKPEKLIEEKAAIVVIVSPVYAYEMYLQLKGMQLGNQIDCYIFPFMQMISDRNKDPDLQFSNISPQKIPKVVHSFWFSGNNKPDSYKKCIDTWHNVLTDYTIVEWNLDNYDWTKNAFCKKAIELNAWAFATDFARLDVLYNQGGIYLDMDVEVFKPFDDLLGNNAILSFSNNIMVDLAVLASCPENRLIYKLLRLYEDVNIPTSKTGFSSFFQPSFIRKTLVENGVKMNGCLQKTIEATVFPKEFFMPQDHVLFRPYKKTENTYCVHYDNFGWSFSKDNKREMKIRNNRRLYDEIMVNNDDAHG